MGSRSKQITTAIALLLVFAISQAYIGVSFADSAPAMAVESAVTTPQQTTGILVTQGNKEISVNGTNVISGATIVSGASIETPATVGATINLGTRGSLEIEPNTKLTVEFDQNGVKVMVTEGCVALLTKKGTTGEVDTLKGVLGKTDPNKDGAIRACPDRTGAAGAAAAGGGAGGLFGLGTAATVAIIVGGATAVIVPLALRGDNPSLTAL